MRTILYNVTFTKPGATRESFLAAVKAVEDNTPIRAYHIDRATGKHIVPDYAAIREALPHYWRKQFDKASWWFPLTLHSDLSGVLDIRNACSVSVYGKRGKRLCAIHATPYLYDR